MLILVRDVSIHYQGQIHGMVSEEITLDFATLFGSQIRAVATRKDQIVKSIWREQLGEYEQMDILTLQSWLKNHDLGMAKLQQDRALTPESRDEFTCEWYQSHLLGFSRSNNDILAIHAPKGHRKTYLSRWIVERLQGPLGKKTRELFPDKYPKCNHFFI